MNGERLLWCLLCNDRSKKCPLIINTKKYWMYWVSEISDWVHWVPLNEWRLPCFFGGSPKSGKKWVTQRVHMVLRVCRVGKLQATMGVNKMVFEELSTRSFDRWSLVQIDGNVFFEHFWADHFWADHFWKLWFFCFLKIWALVFWFFDQKTKKQQPSLK